MQEKIKWYQEVLELEPGSKVFFPLARLLSESGETDAALQTLQHGISRHPEFIEARLYLIDLLFKNQRTEQCNAQVAELTSLFSGYTGFWQAWGAYLGHNSKDADVSLALSFLAASFQNDNLRLADIFAQGLQTALQRTEPAPSLQQKNVDDAAEPCILEEVAAPEAVPTLDEAVGSHPHDGEVAEQDALENFENVAKSDDNAECSPQATASSEVANSQILEESCPPVVPPLSALVQSLPASPVFTLQDEEALIPELTDDSDDETEERFSLRTRSMAEVLAEQGDFKNALDIYQELVAQATSPEEQLDLQHRISTLTARMGTAQNQNAENPVLPDTAPGKHRLLSLLETLAVRFEAHAQG